MSKQHLVLMLVSLVLFGVIGFMVLSKPGDNAGGENSNWNWGVWDQPVEEKQETDVQITEPKAEVKPEPKEEKVQKIEKQITATTYEEALKLAKEYNINIVFTFHAKWCGACKVLDKSLEDATVKTALMKFVYVYIDTEESQEGVDQFGIRLLPTTVVVDSTGKELDKKTGTVPAKRLVTWLERFATKKADVKDVKPEPKSEPKEKKAKEDELFENWDMKTCCPIK